MRPKYFCFGRLFIYLHRKHTPIKANRTMDKLRGFGISAFVALAAFGCFGCGHRSATVGTVNGESVEAPAGDSVVTVRGHLTIAHEVRSFTAEGDSVEYWVVDKSGDLIPRYSSAVRCMPNSRSSRADTATRGLRPNMRVYIGCGAWSRWRPEKESPATANRDSVVLKMRPTDSM